MSGSARLALTFIAVWLLIVVAGGLLLWQHDPLVDQMTVEQELGRAR